jgi:isopentenyldiphosphate isomerase
MFARGLAMTPDPGDELVDRLDDEGRVIGTIARRELRGGRIPHRCAYLLLFNRRGELFVHQRAATKATYPSYWDVCVGGLPGAGESFDDAIRREVEEEVGVRVQPERLFPFHYADDRSVVYGMVYRAVHDGPFRCQAEEVARGEFVPLTEAVARTEREPFCPDGVAALMKYQQWIRKEKN